jgi:hypothetical protein
MELTSPVGSCWVALGMKTEPTHRPRDGHLLARPLILDPPFRERVMADASTKKAS